VADYVEMGTSVLDRVEVLEEMLWRIMWRRGRLCLIGAYEWGEDDGLDCAETGTSVRDRGVGD
jgi:hypothetical protein